MDLKTIRKIQNNEYYDEIHEDIIEQNFLEFLGQHPRIWQQFEGYITQPEVNYIIRHFQFYKVDPRTFEEEFKCLLAESLPIYNHMKSVELIDDVFELVDDNTRKIVSARATSLASNGTKTTTGTTSNNADSKQANKNMPMSNTPSQTIDSIVGWSQGASAIGENKTTGSSSINNSDITALTNNGTDNGNSQEEYERHGNPVEHIDKIWNYLVKPKAINWLTSQLSVAFILVI